MDAGVVPPGPQFLRVRPGGQPEAHRPIAVRLMDAADKAAIPQFARRLPQEELLFLYTDITDPTSKEEWIANIEKDIIVTRFAEPDQLLAGYASLHVNPLRWTWQVGDIAITINVIPEWRSRGLGEGLCAEILALAGILQFEKSLRRWSRSIKARGRCSKGRAPTWSRYCQTGLRIVTVIAGIFD